MRGFFWCIPLICLVSGSANAKSLAIESIGTWTGSYDAVATYGDFILTIAGDPTTLTVYDASNPQDITVALAHTFAMRWDDILVSRDGKDPRAFLTGNSPTFSFDLTDPSVLAGVKTWSFAVDGKVIAASPYLVQVDYGSIHVYDETSEAVESWSYTHDCGPEEYCTFETWRVVGNLAIAFDSWTCHKCPVACWSAPFFDLTQPDSPLVGNFGLGCNDGESHGVSGIYAAPDELYVTVPGFAGWYVYDTSDPADVRWSATAAVRPVSPQVVFERDLILSRGFDLIRVYDQTDRSQPILKADAQVPGLTHFEVRGDRIYAHTGSGIEILELQETVSVLLREFDVRATEAGVHLRWSLATEEPPVGVDIFRNEPDTPPTRVNRSPLPAQDTEYLDASALRGHRYSYQLRVMAADGNEVTSSPVAVEVPGGFLSLSRGHPSPFSSSTFLELEVPNDRGVSIRVYDAQGRRVRTLARPRATLGVGRIEWDGRDDNGAALPSGSYYVRVSAAGEARSTRVLLVR